MSTAQYGLRTKGFLKYTYLMVVCCTALIRFSVFAQDDFYHPELDWQTIETKHFRVHFHTGTERTAKEVATIAESVYPVITAMYNHEPDQRVSFIIRDHDDYSNGGAYFYENRIEIFAPALDFEFRGTHPWLWNVVTHEFTHIIQIQTTMKFGRKIPGIYFQWLGYEAERRPDVLYGFPNVIVSYPFSGFVVPSWFAEGTAQYNNPTLGYDYWDSHRDMILRMYMLDGNPLGWDEMGVFGKNGLGNESSYNAGFSIVSYIGQKYGNDKLVAISRKLSAPFRMTIDGAIENVLGKTGKQLYSEWKSEKTDHYIHVRDSIGSTATDTMMFEGDGFGNFYPVFTPDGSKIAYVSNKGEDYLSLSSIYLYDCKTKTSEMIVPGVRSTLSFSPDGQNLYYAQITRGNPHWSAYSDLFRYNVSTKETKRLTFGLRALNPKLSRDGKKVVFAYGSDGTLNIGVCDTNGSHISQVTNFRNGEQVYTAVWSPDGSKIAFGYSLGHNQTVALIDSNGNNLKLLSRVGDSRDPFFISDSILCYSWDRGGIFNIYSLNLLSKNNHQLTNVLGGAFLPTVNAQGDMAYATYTSTGYKLALMYKDTSYGKNILPDSIAEFDTVKITAASEGISDVPQRADAQISKGEKTDQVIKSYKSVFTSLSFIPLLRFDNYTQGNNVLDMIKPGLYIGSSEVLGTMNIFGGGAVNRNWERDLFLVFEYTGRLPLLYQLHIEPVASLELYNITRKRKFSFDLNVNPTPESPYGLQTFDVDITYSMIELDLSLKQKIIAENCELKLMYTLSKYNQDVGSWIHPDFTQPISSSRSTYFIGNMLSAQLKFDGIHRTIDKDINPIGRTMSLKYFYDLDNFNPTDSTENKNGFRVPIYTHYNFSRIEFGWMEHLALPFNKHTLSLGLTADAILGPPIDNFFDYYVGGFVGMRGYPFYAISGNKAVALNATYRFPLSTELNFRFFQLYFKKLFGSVFYDMGNAWTGSMPSAQNWKHDVGFELRLEAFSYYAYPTRIFFSGAYGLDKFSRSVEDINIKTVTYGKEWRFYLGILFGFELNDIFQRQNMR